MYLELCTKPKLLCDFYSVIQVLVDRSEIDRSELLAPCLKCILNRLPNKMYNDVLVSKSMCQIKHFGVCFPLTCKASSKFITLFFFTCPAKRAPQNPRTDRGAGDSRHNFAGCFLQHLVRPSTSCYFACTLSFLPGHYG